MPKPNELLFALKTFAGAMAALYFALWLGLENPYWSMATVFIVAQPLTGAMRSKSLYRAIGTVIGGTAAVILVPNLVDAPVLLSLAMALWVGLCLYLSLLDRTPRAYVFILAGYTAGIIGFPSVANPGDIFLTALTRVEEILLGIACTTVVGTVVFPRPLGPVLATRISGWARPGIDWAIAALGGEEEDAQTRRSRHRLAVEVSDVAMLTTHLAFDTSNLASAVRHIERFQICVLSLMPVLSSISDRVRELRHLSGITPTLQSVLDETADWVRAGGPEDADAVHASIASLNEDEPGWAALLRSGLTVRLAELVSIIHHARAIRRHVFEGDVAPASPVVEREYIAIAAKIRDHGLALLSACAAAVSILLVCAFWIETGWTAGAGAAVIVAVGCSFFAAQDDPAPAIALMLRHVIIAVLGAGLYTFAILPRVETFFELALVLLPAGLITGTLISRPATFGTGMVMGAVGATTLALNNGYAGNFVDYLNNSLALILGLATALTVTKLIRSLGAAFSARRIARAAWGDIAAAAAPHSHQDRAALTGLLLDRLGLLMPRLAAVSPGADIAAVDLLHDLRAGLNVIGLQRKLPGLPPRAQSRIEATLSDIATHYRGNALNPPPDALLEKIDAAISTLSIAVPSHREALMILSGLRSVLFPGATPPELNPGAGAPDDQRQAA
jgi:uncharacterized membrane protein YccC